MPRRCQKYSCGRYLTKKSLSKYLPFPTSPDLIEQWIAFCQQPRRIRTNADGTHELVAWIPPTIKGSDGVLCSDHFRDDDFTNQLYKTLRPGAIPSIAGEDLKPKWGTQLPSQKIHTQAPPPLASTSSAPTPSAVFVPGPSVSGLLRSMEPTPRTPQKQIFQVGSFTLRSTPDRMARTPVKRTAGREGVAGNKPMESVGKSTEATPPRTPLAYSGAPLFEGARVFRDSPSMRGRTPIKSVRYADPLTDHPRPGTSKSAETPLVLEEDTPAEMSFESPAGQDAMEVAASPGPSARVFEFGRSLRLTPQRQKHYAASPSVTRFLHEPSSHTVPAARQWVKPDTPLYGHPRLVNVDHPYVRQQKNVDPVVTGRPPLQVAKKRGRPVTKSQKPKEQSQPMATPSESSSSEPSPKKKSQPRVSDSEYQPSTETETEPESGTEKSEAEVLTEMRKYLVYESKLDLLTSQCREGQCIKPVIERKREIIGTMVKYTCWCLDRHRTVWSSQPVIGMRPAGNIALASSILLSGNSYSKIHAFAHCLGMPIIGRTAFNYIQRDAIFPTVQLAWKEEKQRVVRLVDGAVVILAGDGRCDSPGHCAKYGCYTFMLTGMEDPNLEGKIIECQLTDIAEESIKNSQHLEPEGMRRGLDQLLYHDDVNIGVFATDRHVTIASILRKEYEFICHQFDIWHLVKNVQKKLTAACRRKGGENLAVWRQSITNHLWWCCATCDGDEQILREKWFSILHHIQNKHRWTGGENINKCSHPRLTKKEKKDKIWLDPDSAAFKTLQSIVSDKLLLKAFPQLTEFCHTGSLEIFHSVMLKYCPKRQHFPHPGMKARYFLAALDWNAMPHETRVPQSAEDVEVVYSKRRGEYVVRSKARKGRKEATSEIGVQLLKRVLDLYINKEVESTEQMAVPSDLRQRISRKEKPDARSKFETYFSRTTK